MSSDPDRSVDSDGLNPAVPARAQHYAGRFAAGRPFRHVVIDDFLDEAFCADVCAQFPVFDEAAALNEDGKVGGKATQEKVRALGPAYRRLDDLVQSAPFLALVGRISGIPALRYDPWYFGGGTHENRPGQDLDPHVDFNYHPITRQHRRLNLIIYLNEQWDDTWGGSLQLHLDPYREPADDEIVTVTPLRNRCVIFETTERSWHGFERICPPAEHRDVSRRSFAVYFYTTERPPAETAAEHSTVYVERHLPPRFAPGYTLAEADVVEIKRLLARRDQHLRRLYRRLQIRTAPEPAASWARRFESRLAGALRSFEDTTGLPVTPPLRALRRLLRGH
jgi:hypothetical protein